MTMDMLNAEQDEQEPVIYPTLMNRVQALFFDFWIVVALAIFLSSYVFSEYEDKLVGFRVVLFVIILFIYEPIGVMTGGTIGYRTMGLKVRRSDDETRRLNIIQAYGRSVLKFFLGWVSFLTISSDSQRRAIHDKASGSVVLFAKS